MSFRIKEENYQKILSMFKEGKTYNEITEATGLSKKSAYLSIGLARERGDLPKRHRKRKAEPSQRFNGIARRAGAPVGKLGLALANELNEDVLRKVADLTVKNGYGTIAEYATDLLVEEVFREKG